MRHRAKEIMELIDDPVRLRDEREKAQANRNKYTGVAAEEVRSISSNSFNQSSFSSNNYRSSGSANNESFNSANSTYATSQSASVAASVPAVKMANTNPAPASVPAPQPQQNEANLLDLDFGAPAAPAQSFNNAASSQGWANFAQASQNPVQQQTPQQSQFGGFVSSPPPLVMQQQPQQSFGGFVSSPPPVVQQQQHNAFANFGAFQQPSQSSFVSTPVAQQAKQDDGWANFSSAPSFTVQSSMQPQQFQQGNQIKKDPWGTDLVNLDGLGKYEAPKQNTGPSLSQLSRPNTNTNTLL